MIHSQLSNVAENYVNLGEIQSATAPSSDTLQAQSTPVSAPGSTPAAIAPGTAPVSAPASVPPTPPVQPSAPAPLPPLPPPPPAENAVAAVSASSPPKEETAGTPVAINPVHAPALKLFNDCNIDSDAKSATQKVASRKTSKGSASDPRKMKNRGTNEDSEENKKPKQFYFARGCYCFCFFFFFALLIVWALVAVVALNFLHIEFLEKMIMNFG